MNIAYILSAYKHPALLVRLVERLDAPGTSIVVHVDARSEERVFRAMADPLAHRPNVLFLPRHACHWGDFGHVAASLKGLRAIVSAGRPFDYVVLLTGQDYPIRSNEEIHTTFREAAGRIFLDWMTIPNELWTDGGAYRIEHRHFRIGRRLYSFPGAPFRSAPWNGVWARLSGLLGLRRSFPPGMRPFGGSAYWALPADCARYVDSYAREHPDFVRFFRHVHVPDEIFFQTVVLNSPFRERVVADDLRHVEWEGDEDSPRILTTADFEKLAGSEKLFARKFDPDVDADVLDRIDAVLLTPVRGRTHG